MNEELRIVNICDDRNAPCRYLPEELILENILTRLPARTLGICSCVSKLWYHSISNDSRFASHHLAHNKNKFNLVFSLLNVPYNKSEKVFFLGLKEKNNSHNNDDETLCFKLLAGISFLHTSELVGYCNGLVCMKTVVDDARIINVINPTRDETLSFSYPAPSSTTGNGQGSCKYLCHGFGFDSSSQRYKVVVIYTSIATTSNNEEEEEFVSMVVTLGERDSCRRIVTSTAQMKIRASRTNRKSATTCEGDLFWRITADNNDNEIDMLLSFDIHSEKIQLIQLPIECNQTSTTITTINDQNQYVVVDHHLLQYKGYLCVARSEKIMVNKRHHNHHHCNNVQSSLCCCRFRVHIYALKDKVKQVWTKGETFDIEIKEESLLPPPFCCYFDTITTNPPTRMLSFSDQLLLYWFDGEYLILFNLQKKHFKVVKSCNSSDEKSRDIFERKMHKGIRPGRIIDENDNSSFPYMDYQLHAQVENMHSLKTFIPRGEVGAFDCYKDLHRYVSNSEKDTIYVVNTGRCSIKFYVCFS